MMNKILKLKPLYPVKSGASGNKGLNMTSLFRLATLILIPVSLLLTNQVNAKTIKCWTNKNGVRECGRSVPPEYSQTRIEIVNERGLIVDVIEAAKSKEELELEREREELRKLREKERKEQARLDNILLNTFTTERDLLLARDNNLKAVQGQIDISKGNLKLLETNLGELQGRAANIERAGKKPPEKLINEINEMAEAVKKKKQHIEKKESDQKDLQERFAHDLKRFRELKSGRVN